jgi:uncharacterized protein
MSEPRTARCPVCKQPTAHDTRPFCSKRCRDVDLGRWLGGNYVIAGGNADADEDGDGNGTQPPSANVGGGDSDD